MSDNDYAFKAPERVDAESIATGHIAPYSVPRPVPWGLVGYLAILIVVVCLAVLIGHQQYQINILETKIGVLDGILGNLHQST